MSCCGQGAISRPQDAPNSQVQTSGIHTASDDTLSVTLHVSPTAETRLSLRYIYSLFGQVILYSN